MTACIRNGGWRGAMHGLSDGVASANEGHREYEGQAG
jgi:hypothetical protein